MLSANARETDDHSINSTRPSASIDFRKQSPASPDDALDSSGTLAAISCPDSGGEEYSRTQPHENRYCCCERRAHSYFDWRRDIRFHCCSTNRPAAPGIDRLSHPSDRFGSRLHNSPTNLHTIPTHCRAYRTSPTRSVLSSRHRVSHCHLASKTDPGISERLVRF